MRKALMISLATLALAAGAAAPVASAERGERLRERLKERIEARRSAPAGPEAARTRPDRTLSYGSDRLQALVQRAVRECGPAGQRLIHAQMMERTARYPMRPDARALNHKLSTAGSDNADRT